MVKIAAKIQIEEEDALDLFDDLVEMEVEEDHRLAAAFRIKVVSTRGGDGLWRYLDDERVRLWNRLVVTVTADDEEHELVSGYVTHLRASIAPAEEGSHVEILGMDVTSLMALEEKLKDWPGKSDGDIAREIFQNYGLAAEVEETGVMREEAVNTTMQRETDIQFLKRLARRNGFDCFVKGGRGYFRRPVLTDPPLAVLAAHFGEETTLTSFEAKADALRPTRVESHQLDVIAKEPQVAAVEESGLRPLGRDAALSLAPPDGVESRLYVKHAVGTTVGEMKNLGGALVEEAGWFVEGRGEVDTSVYGAVLQARRLVPVKGVGEAFSGLYYLTNVRHVFGGERYIQHFRGRRNALAPTGPADFAGGGLPFGF
ncbi:MAG TPA: contractile injection system protein, VgrG/Pvc8 family [Pyrinomonadaceae bacterium]|jgi:hypothetical protein